MKMPEKRESERGANALQSIRQPNDAQNSDAPICEFGGGTGCIPRASQSLTLHSRSLFSKEARRRSLVPAANWSTAPDGRLRCGTNAYLNVYTHTVPATGVAALHPCPLAGAFATRAQSAAIADSFDSRPKRRPAERRRRRIQPSQCSRAIAKIGNAKTFWPLGGTPLVHDLGPLTAAAPSGERRRPPRPSLRPKHVSTTARANQNKRRKWLKLAETRDPEHAHPTVKLGAHSMRGGAWRRRPVPVPHSTHLGQSLVLLLYTKGRGKAVEKP